MSRELVDPVSGAEHPPVKVNITLWDLVKMNITVLPRLTSIWVAFGLIAGATGLVGISTSGVPHTTRHVLALLWLMVVISGLSIGTGLIFALASGLLAAKRGSGILGEHVYAIQSDGLREQTSVNDTLIKWGGAHDLVRTSAFLLIRLGPALSHILPRRSFSSEDEYSAFWRAIQPLRRTASK